MHDPDRRAGAPVNAGPLCHVHSTGMATGDAARDGADPQSRAAPAITWESALTAGKSNRTTSRELEAALEKLRLQIQLAEGTRARLFRPIRGPGRVSLPKRNPGDGSVRILLTRDGRMAYSRRLNQVGLDDLVFCHPMRVFSRRQGQTNKPVAFFSRTVGDLVACESQHERRFAILADWHETVVHIASQPFTIDFPPGHELDSHTPDFLLISACGVIVIVDVKWPSDAMNTEVLERHAIVKRVLMQAGMQHVVWTDAPRVFTENLANFAAARVPADLMRDLAPKLIATYRPGISIATLLQKVAEVHCVPTSTSLVVLRRLLWDHQFAIDMSAPFSQEAQVWRK
jgi:hypothetical protein